MQTNFTSDPLLRHVLLCKAPKYGNDIEEADEMVAYAAKQYCDSANQYRDPDGGAYRAGLFCLSSNTPLGRQVCALPSGREAGTPLGDGGISPKHGMQSIKISDQNTFSRIIQGFWRLTDWNLTTDELVDFMQTLSFVRKAFDLLASPVFRE